MTKNTRSGRKVDAWTRFSIDRESVGSEPGAFRAILASNGEASDGHILSIDGMRVPDSMPMLFRHQSTPEIPTLGRIVEPEKSREGDRELLRVTGRFDLEGESSDPLLAIRKGFASLVRSGSLDAMSVRWDPVFGKFQPRHSLPEGHFAHVPRGTEGPSAFGMFFEESEAREGSVVAIGADPAALMGRAHDAESLFEEAFWLTLAGRVGRGEAAAELPPDQRAAFEAMTKVLVETVQRSTQEAFQLARERSEEVGSESPDDLGDPAEAAPASASREAPAETKDEKNEPPAPRVLSLDEIRSLARETAEESVERRVAFMLGRV